MDSLRVLVTGFLAYEINNRTGDAIHSSKALEIARKTVEEYADKEKTDELVLHLFDTAIKRAKDLEYKIYLEANTKKKLQQPYSPELQKFVPTAQIEGEVL